MKLLIINRSPYVESILNAKSDLDSIRHLEPENTQRELARLRRRPLPGQKIYRTQIRCSSVFKTRTDAVQAWPALWYQIAHWSKEMNFGLVNAIWESWVERGRPGLTLRLEFVQDSNPIIEAT